MTKKKLQIQYHRWLRHCNVCSADSNSNTFAVAPVRDWHVSPRFMISEAIHMQCVYDRSEQAHAFVYAERITWLLDHNGDAERAAARTYHIITSA